MRRGTEWFINDMVLLFVPAVLAVLDHRELFGLVGLKVLAAVQRNDEECGCRGSSRSLDSNSQH